MPAAGRAQDRVNPEGPKVAVGCAQNAHIAVRWRPDRRIRRAEKQERRNAAQSGKVTDPRVVSEIKLRPAKLAGQLRQRKIFE